uniref:C-type LECtin n=1 Tax=Caenorhabditis tropicalis TaxID=1561998 RepID=A0A1I7UGL0_9PELO
MRSVLLFALVSYAACITCPTGFTAVNDQKCLRVFANKLKHLEAETDCSYLGGTLVTIKTAIDNRGVATLAANAGASQVWIGMFCYATGNSTTCYHDDNSGTLTYKSFAAGNPQIDGNGGCVYMSTASKTSGQWFSAPCQVIGMPFVCEVPPTISDPICKRNYNGYCYMPSHELKTDTVNTDFQTAQGICQSFGGNLASIHSKPEIDYVKAIYRSSGVTRLRLGAQAFLPDTFDWVDGSNFDFDYTDPLATSSGDCLLMDLSSRVDNGLWSEVSCSDNEYFLCKRKLEGPTVASTSAPVSTVAATNAMGSTIAAVNPKFQRALPHRQELLDFSNCNTTLYMAPGVITSFGYPNTKPPVTYCTWNLATLGPYRIGVYFTDFSVYNPVYVYDENGNLIRSGAYNLNPFSVLGTSNIVTVTHDSRYDAAYDYHGFSATILPF